MSAPLLISAFTVSLCPLQLAMYRGVEPSCVRGISDEHQARTQAVKRRLFCPCNGLGTRLATDLMIDQAIVEVAFDPPFRALDLNNEAVRSAAGPDAHAASKCNAMTVMCTPALRQSHNIFTIPTNNIFWGYSIA